jgi:hypothetical protein
MAKLFEKEEDQRSKMSSPPSSSLSYVSIVEKEQKEMEKLLMQKELDELKERCARLESALENVLNNNNNNNNKTSKRTPPATPPPSHLHPGLSGTKTIRSTGSTKKKASSSFSPKNEKDDIKKRVQPTKKLTALSSPEILQTRQSLNMLAFECEV